MNSPIPVTTPELSREDDPRYSAEYNPFDDLETLQISNSSQSMLETCPMKFGLIKVWDFGRTVPFDAPTLAFADRDFYAARSGQAMHAGIQGYFTHLSEGNSYLEAKDFGIHELARHYPWHMQKSPWVSRSGQACIATFLDTIEQPFFKRHRLVNVLTNDGEKAGVEVPFAIRFQNFSLRPDGEKPLTVEYVGFIDLLLEDMQVAEPHPFISDIKSTRYELDDYFALYGHDTQCLPYSMVLNTILGSDPLEVDITYIVQYLDLMTPRTQFVPLKKSQKDFYIWANEVALALGRLKQYISNRYFPRRGGLTCMSYNSLCSQHMHCTNFSEQYLQVERELSVRAGTLREPVKPWFVINLELEL